MIILILPIFTSVTSSDVGTKNIIIVLLWILITFASRNFCDSKKSRNFRYKLSRRMLIKFYNNA